MLEQNIDAKILRARRFDFEKLAAKAEPEELQRLLRWTVRRIEWDSEGMNRLQIYALPFPKKRQGEFATNVWSDGLQDRYVEPMWLEFYFVGSDLQDEATLLCTDEMLVEQLEKTGVETPKQEDLKPQLIRQPT